MKKKSIQQCSIGNDFFGRYTSLFPLARDLLNENWWRERVWRYVDNAKVKPRQWQCVNYVVEDDDDDDGIDFTPSRIMTLPLFFQNVLISEQ